MTGCAGYPFIPPEYMGDSHVMVIDHIGQVVGGEAVRFEQDQIIEDIALIFDLSPDLIVEDYGLP